MSNLEDRYIVIKKNRLNDYESKIIKAFLDVVDERQGGNCRVEAIVIESHWPEFETVVKMLFDRIITEGEVS